MKFLSLVDEVDLIPRSDLEREEAALAMVCADADESGHIDFSTRIRLSLQLGFVRARIKFGDGFGAPRTTKDDEQVANAENDALCGGTHEEE